MRSRKASRRSIGYFATRKFWRGPRAVLPDNRTRYVQLCAEDALDGGDLDFLADTSKAHVVAQLLVMVTRVAAITYRREPWFRARRAPMCSPVTPYFRIWSVIAASGCPLQPVWTAATDRRERPDRVELRPSTFKPLAFRLDGR